MGQQNRNASYFYAIDGHTPWERLRVIRNFLNDRRSAYKMAIVGIQRAEAIDKKSFEYQEWLIGYEELAKNLEDCKREIEFLERMEAELVCITEPTRIPGKSDEEMYEINYFSELVEMTVHNIQAEIIAEGRISKDSVKALLRNPSAMNRAIDLRLIAEDSIPILTGAQKPLIMHTNKLGLILENDHEQLFTD